MADATPTRLARWSTPLGLESVGRVAATSHCSVKHRVDRLSRFRRAAVRSTGRDAVGVLRVRRSIVRGICRPLGTNQWVHGCKRRRGAQREYAHEDKYHEHRSTHAGNLVAAPVQLGMTPRPRGTAWAARRHVRPTIESGSLASRDIRRRPFVGPPSLGRLAASPRTNRECRDSGPPEVSSSRRGGISPPVARG